MFTKILIANRGVRAASADATASNGLARTASGD